MATLLVMGGPVYTPYQIYEPGMVLVEGGHIRAVGHPSEVVGLAEGAQVINVAGACIIPGLIDIHIHGVGGKEVTGATLADVIELLPLHGITAFLPTTYPVRPEVFADELALMADLIEAPPVGARAAGIHLEGPYFNPAKAGMADPALLYPLSRADFEKWQAAARGRIRMVTFAPEEGEALSLVPWLIESDVIPTMGHSDADFDTVSRAVALGVRHATHTFNAMRGLHHREPGLAGAVLYYRQIVGQLIADGHHVHPAVMAVMLRAKGVDRVCLISDAVPFATLPPGRYRWGRYEIILDGETSRLPDGTLAGSAQMINTMLGVLVDKVGLSLAEALVTATVVPADVLGLNKGRLEAGREADIVALDERYQPSLTIIGGEVIYRA
jgi:N-acetylglucosamine-6-phosphate deacetylase